jgi:putative ABC transport system permease protein
MRRVTFKGLLARKLRLVLTAVSISLGVAFVAGTLVLSDTMTATFDQLYAGLTKGIDVSVRGKTAFTDTANFDDPKPIPQALLDDVRAVDGVAAAEGSLTGYALILDKDGEPVQPGGAPTLGANYPNDEALSGGYALRSGAAPHGKNEVVLDAATAAAHDFAPGDPVTVMFADGARDFTVSGVIGFGDADNLAGATMALFDTPTAQRVLGKPGQFDQINMRAESAVDSTELQQRVEAVLPDGVEAVTTQTLVDEASDAIADALGFFTKALLGFAAVSLLVGALIIWNTFSILVAQRTRELALLRAVGATRRQVRASVVLEAVVMGLVSSALGLAAGVGVAAGLRALLSAFGLDVPSTTLQVLPRTVVVAVLVGVVVTVVASLAPARQATKVAPIAALRAVDAPARALSRWRVASGAALTVAGFGGLGWAMLEKDQLAATALAALVTLAGVLVVAPVLASGVTRVLGAPLARLAGTTGKLARRNALRNPRRTASTATALMIGLALVAAVTVVATSMKASVADVIDRSSRSDFILKAASQMAPGIPTSVAEELRSLDGVATVAEMRFAMAQVNGSITGVAAIDPATAGQAAELDLTSGSLQGLTDERVLISTRLADARDLAVGDQLEIVYPNTGPQSLTVAGTYANSALLGTDYAVTLGNHARNTSNPLDVAVLVVAEDGAADTARAGIEAALAGYPNVQLDDAASFKETQAATVDQLLTIVTRLLLLAVVIALLGIVNTLALSVFERTRELGLLRAVGMTRRQVRAVVRWESVIVAVLGALLGAGLGVAFGLALTRGLASEGMSIVQVPVGRLAVYVALAAVAGVLAAVGPARRAARVDVLRAVAAS